MRGRGRIFLGFCVERSHPEALQRLTDWHNQIYDHSSEFGDDDLIPRFKAEKWDPDALVKTVKDVY